MRKTSLSRAGQWLARPFHTDTRQVINGPRRSKVRNLAANYQLLCRVCLGFLQVSLGSQHGGLDVVADHPSVPNAELSQKCSTFVGLKESKAAIKRRGRRLTLVQLDREWDYCSLDIYTDIQLTSEHVRVPSNFKLVKRPSFE